MGGQKQQDDTKGTMLSACWAWRMGGCRHAFLPALSPWGQRPHGPHGQCSSTGRLWGWKGSPGTRLVSCQSSLGSVWQNEWQTKKNDKNAINLIATFRAGVITRVTENRVNVINLFYRETCACLLNLVPKLDHTALVILLFQKCTKCLLCTKPCAKLHDNVTSQWNRFPGFHWHRVLFIIYY